MNALIKRMPSQAPTLFNRGVNLVISDMTLACLRTSSPLYFQMSGTSIATGAGPDGVKAGMIAASLATHETAIWGTKAISGMNPPQVFAARSGTRGIWETATTSNNFQGQN